MEVTQNKKKPLGKQAIVIGCSIAGMLSARVLSDYFERVTILDRDSLPSIPQARCGVPQSVQPHVLLTKGYRLLTEFFPGIESQLEKHGVLQIDWAQEFQYYVEGSWSAKAEEASDIVSVTCSRYLLEWTIRQELSQLARIEIIPQSKVAGLLYVPEADRITGVKLSSGTKLTADLVVDASGRSSSAAQWLEAVGQATPPETVVNPYLGYATRRYQLPENLSPDWKVMLISQTPPQDTRLGYLARIENDELIATLGGYGKDFPPLDDQGFLAFAQSLAQPNFYQAIANATPTSPVYAHRATANRRRDYDQITLPVGFIAVGDAVCALCPVYGQGMSVSALAAKTLQAWLNKSSPTKLDNNRFQKQLAKDNSFHWTVATSQDSRFPTTAGGQQKSVGMIEKLMAGYMTRLVKVSATKPNLRLMFIEISHLLRSPLHFYHPAVIWQVLTAKAPV